MVVSSCVKLETAMVPASLKLASPVEFTSASNSDQMELHGPSGTMTIVMVELDVRHALAPHFDLCRLHEVA
jgi:hypothetical protein